MPNAATAPAPASAPATRAESTLAREMPIAPMSSPGGMISPLKALNFLIHSFESDILTIDYRVRGFTRDVIGNKHFIDHQINSIQNYIDQETQDRYQMIDVNIYQENIFHTKMLLKDFDLNTYLFHVEADDLKKDQRERIEKSLKQEMYEIFYGRNI